MSCLAHYSSEQGKLFVEQIIVDDLAKTGRCRFTRAKDSFLNGFLVWGVPRGAWFNDHINKA